MTSSIECVENMERETPQNRFKNHCRFDFARSSEPTKFFPFAVVQGMHFHCASEKSWRRGFSVPVPTGSISATFHQTISTGKSGDWNSLFSFFEIFFLQKFQRGQRAGFA
jgi:hypothetical protein